jgi:hypothetical protein
LTCEEVLYDSKDLKLETSIRRIENVVDNGSRGRFDHESRISSPEETQACEYSRFSFWRKVEIVQFDEDIEHEISDRVGSDFVESRPNCCSSHEMSVTIEIDVQ